MKITKQNYEEFILDFIEGNLSQKDTLLFQQFLELNPDVETEIMDFENVILPDENIVFQDKDLLKKTEFSRNFNGNYLEELCIANIENDITDEQKNDLEKIFTEFPEKIAVYDSFKKAKLIPNLEIKYDGKEDLKKKQVLLRPGFVYFVSAVAASLILFFLIIGLNKNEFAKSLSYSQVENRIENNKIVFTQNIVAHDSQIANNNTERVIFNNSQIRDTNNIAVNIIDTAFIIDTKMDKIVINVPKLQQSYDYEISNFETQKYYENYKNYNNTILFEAQKKFLENKKGIEKINAWNVAQVAVNNYNNLTENDISLEGQFDKSGGLKAVSFNTQVFGFYTNKVKRFGISH